MDNKSNKNTPKKGHQNFRKKKAPIKETSFKVTAECELIEFLMQQFPARSRNKIKTWLKNKNIEVNHQIETGYNRTLTAGDKVVVFWGRIFEGRDLKGLRIEYEDQDVIVVYKPTGLLSVATDKVNLTAYSILSDHIKVQNPKNRIFIVHRLDRETSGLMLFARSVEVQQLLQHNWKEMVFERKYIAVTSGTTVREDGEITSYLVESKSLKVYSTQDKEKGKLATTHYKTLQRNEPFSLVEIVLDTGRKNQIRVHMSDLGMPIVGDKKYGSPESPFNRIGLHSWILGFTHPVTKEPMQFKSEIPKEFLRLFDDE
ncbi:MAG: RluA family pseudouridine synthase [Bacteroidales bacterium]|nr:RluA family pseudouridine synthase [Bacteroidales bacterium]MDY0142361.1 RluA family pseudouridine synthase [Bacteroidales bacterium]